MERENKFKVAKIRISVKLQWGIILTKKYYLKKNKKYFKLLSPRIGVDQN